MNGIRGIALLALLLGGCVAKSPYTRDAISLPATWKTEGAAGAVSVPPPDLWWSSFGDVELAALLRKATAGSLDLRAGVARVKIAADMVAVARSRGLPELSIGGAPVDPGAITARDGPRRDSARYALGLDAHYELDFWRRVSGTVEASEWEERASALDAEAIRAALEMSVAHTYFEIRRFDEAAAIEARRVSLSRERLRLVDLRLQAGRTGAEPVLEAREAVRDAEERLGALGRERALAEQRLALLLGENPESLSIATAPLRTRVLAPVPPAGLPSSLLERRPDVRAAEARLAALHARIAVARAALFPRVALTARLGFASDVLRDITPKLLYGVGPEIEYSVFDSGAREAELDASRWRREEALAEYRKAILAALADVERTLLGYQASVEAEARHGIAREERRAQTERVRGALAAGRSTRLAVIDAEDRELAVDLAALQTYAARLDSLLGLYQALGGGWEAGPSAGVAKAWVYDAEVE